MRCLRRLLPRAITGGAVPSPRRRRHGLAGAAMLALLLAAAPAQALQGQVVRVTDGDTLWLRVAGQARPGKVRLQGIDAPELCQSGGVQARRALEALVLGRRVAVRLGPPDVYGRRLVQVYVGRRDVAGALVAAGWAWNDDHRGRSGRYAAAERAARQQHLGVFQADDAMPPRAFRQAHGSCIGPTPPRTPARP